MLELPAFQPLHRFSKQVDWDTVLAAPMFARGSSLGTLTTYFRREREPDEEAIAFQVAIADQAAVAIDNARLFVEAQDKAVLEERARLAHDLHDSATQTVFSLGMLGRAAQEQHERGSARLGDTLDRVATLAQEALVEMRALLFELRPDVQLEQGLDVALTRLADTSRSRMGMSVEYMGEPVPRLRDAAETAIFRIAQEALGNAGKHAQASEVGVRLSVEDGHLRVKIRDNGVGFDPAAPVMPSPDGTRGGQGLRSMQERAEAAGLSLRVESAPGAGTTVLVEAPLPREQ
jgi:signal transduction histidine kinase